MTRRFILSELADGIAKRATIPVSFAEEFVQSFFDVIEEALVKEKIVKVKGLGTFKLVDVEARESVNVNTGERILLSAHSKVTFTPDASLRDAINRPFADFETVILNDDTPTEQMEAIEAEPDVEQTIEEHTTDVQTESDSQEKLAHEEPQPDDVPVDENVAADADVIAEEPSEVEPAKATSEDSAKLLQTVDAPAESQILNESSDVSATVERQETELQASEYQASEHQEIEHKETANNTNMVRRTIQNILAAILCLFLGYAICYYFRPFELPTLSPASSEKTTKETTTSEVKAKSEAEAVVSTETQESTEVQEAADAQPAEPEATPANPQGVSYPQVEGGGYEIVGVKGTEVMSPGKTLLNISLKYYKSTDYVPYICKMNGIDNPDIVPLGKELQIPELKHK